MKNKRMLHIMTMFMICMCGLFIMSGCGGCKCVGKMTSCGLKTCINGCVTCGDGCYFGCESCVNACNEDLEEN